MDLYPYATQQLLSPEATKPVSQGGEPAIIPWQICLHTHGFRGTSEAVGRVFAQRNFKVESHASNKLNGRLIQFQDFLRQADAQGFANGFRLPNKPGKLYGALSVEHEEDASHKFSQAQIVTDGLFIAWAHKKYGIPIALCKTPTSPGITYHKQFPVNNPSKHGCPYDEQVAQIPEIFRTAEWFLGLDQPMHSDIVGRLTIGASRWALQRDGGVITEAGDKFYGSYLGLPAKDRQGDRYFGKDGIQARTDGKPGYVLVSNRGEKYTLPVG